MVSCGLICLNLRKHTPGWGGGPGAGEVVRVEYVHATRMVRFAWGGQAFDLCLLPAAHDISHTRFGFGVTRDNSMRITGLSLAGACASGELFSSARL